MHLHGEGPISFEEGITPATLAELKKKGHDVKGPLKSLARGAVGLLNVGNMICATRELRCCALLWMLLSFVMR